MSKYDVIIAGAGHNGLMAGAYLAKAGLNVCVVEHQDKIGGGAQTRELTLPGFKHDVCSTWHGFIAPNPVIKDDELELQAKYGLKYLKPEVMTGVIFDDDSVFVLHQNLDKTCQSIAKISEHDAVAYRKFHDWSIRMLDMLTMGMFNPPPPFGAQMAMMDQSPEGRELIRAQMISAWDVVDEIFENDKIKIALSRYASEAMINPFVKGTGFTLFIFIPMIHKYGGGIPEGGSGELSEAMGRLIEANGGTIKLSSTVKEFKISDDEVTGVILTTGEEILAGKAVVSGMSIKQMFPGMTGGHPLPEGFAQSVKNLSPSNFAPIHQHLALNEVPKFKSSDKDVNDAFWIEFSSCSKEEYWNAFHALDLGYPRDDLYLSISYSKWDKTRAPAGKHTLYLYGFAPYDLADGGAQMWKEKGQEVADGILSHLRERTTNMGDNNILGRSFMTPLDFEQHNPAFVHADIGHIGCFNWQLSGNRPLPGWNYRMPLKKLYLSSSSSHPGTGIVGGGRAAVQVVMEDLGIDFDKVVKK
ncbi:MAG: NAD(P)/FAD-dependent oxidoreductase [Proteobacteria bacterium]|nr:NAD(P)/FAD-dependent oxidoreductase [Pseudomonadota bacterium]